MQSLLGVIITSEHSQPSFGDIRSLYKIQVQDNFCRAEETLYYRNVFIKSLSACDRARPGQAWLSPPNCSISARVSLLFSPTQPAWLNTENLSNLVHVPTQLVLGPGPWSWSVTPPPSPHAIIHTYMYTSSVACACVGTQEFIQPK